MYWNFFHYANAAEVKTILFSANSNYLERYHLTIELKLFIMIQEHFQNSLFLYGNRTYITLIFPFTNKADILLYSHLQKFKTASKISII